MGLRKFGWVIVCALALQIGLVTPASAYEWPELLQVGDKGRAVVALQVRVAGWYPDKNQTLFEIDGVFSEHTETALQAFQTHYGLVPDGIAGLATFEALNALEDPDHTTIHFDFSEFWQNRNSDCSKEANRYAGTFEGGKIPEKEVKKNVRRLMWRLEALRAKLGDKPIAINSGFRSVEYNRCIRGASMSQHMYGTAVDMRVVEVSNRKARNYGRGSQVHGIGCYSS
ncbi:MAG: D-Ala-D-Ala carboxypeptidase family metallohydrolase, partial [Actinomycetota bacterium]